MNNFKQFFRNLNKYNKRYQGNVVDLVERYRVSEENSFDGIPTIYYDIYLHDEDIKVGKCDLRLKIDDYMYYYGHIGYNILPEYRGNHYAYYACLMLFNIAHNEFKLDELIITCSLDNIASYKTLKALKGELVEVACIPIDHELYKNGDRYKYIFKYNIGDRIDD